MVTKWFEILNKFKGFGNPSANVWFVGIEEGSSWSDSPEEKDKETYKRYSKGYFWNGPDENNEKYTSVYNVMSEIMIRLGLANGPVAEYRKNLMFKENGGIFQMNLYPLAKPTAKSESWPDHYKEVFGYSKGEIEVYKEYVRKHRFPVLRKFWEEYNPRVTICFGSEYWNDFKQLFALDKTSEEVIDGGYIEVFRRGKSAIFLTPFFSYRKHCMPEERINKLVQRLKREIA